MVAGSRSAPWSRSSGRHSVAGSTATDLVTRQFDPSAIGEVAAIIATRTSGEWLERFDDDACVALVKLPAEALEDDYVRIRGTGRTGRARRRSWVPTPMTCWPRPASRPRSVRTADAIGWSAGDAVSGASGQGGASGSDAPSQEQRGGAADGLGSMMRDAEAVISALGPATPS